MRKEREKDPCNKEKENMDQEKISSSTLVLKYEHKMTKTDRLVTNQMTLMVSSTWHYVRSFWQVALNNETVHS